MQWFDGSIPDAIQTAKARNSVFIVYISGEDDQSKEMNETWNESAIVELLQSEGCVAVRIKASSDECNFFSQIYPVVVVPSTFFIGTNGVPIEVTGGHMATVDFKEKIQSVIESHKKLPPPNVAASQSQSSTRSVATAPPMEAMSPLSGATAPPPEATAPPVEASSRVTANAPIASTSSRDEMSSSKKPKLEDKVQKVKDFIEVKRDEKEKKDEKDIRLKEVERIQLGRDVQKLRLSQKERDLIEAAQQMKKDKEDDKKARIRVKEQIARDRAERAVKYNKEKADRDTIQEETKRVKLAAIQEAAAEATALRSTTARIQFRLPDGSSVATAFPSSETLQQAYNFAAQKMGGNVTLSTVFPRRTFTDVDMSKTFIELQLAPSAVIMVVKGVKKEMAQAQGGTVSSSGMLGMVMMPIFFIVNILRSLMSSFFASPRPQSTSANSSQNSQASVSRGTTQAYQRKTPKSSGGTSRVEGNVHKFRNADDDNRDDDKDRPTYNGNSTQQL